MNGRCDHKNSCSRDFFFHALLTLVLVTAAGCSQETAPAPEPDIKPNLLLVTVDALRPDHLGTYGYDKNTSPGIDRLAQRGVVFLNAFATSTLTAASLPSMMTSTFPSQNGCFSWSAGYDQMDPEIDSLPMVLKSMGYRTAFISGHGGLGGFGGFNRGWDLFKDEEALASVITSDAIEWMGEHREEAVFLWLHYIDPHFPYRPPSPYDLSFLNEPSSKEEILRWREDNPWTFFGDNEGDAHTYLRNSKEHLDFILAQYDGEIAYADQEIGRLTWFFESQSTDRGFLEIITADHGEAFNDRDDHFFHGGPPYDFLTRVPMILYSSMSSGSVSPVDFEVSTLDVMPTLIQAAGAEIRSTCEGASLLDQVDNRHARIDIAQFAEVLNVESGNYMLGVRFRDRKMILIYSNGTLDQTEVYDIQEDPHERRNLWNGKGREFEDLVILAEDFIREHSPPTCTERVETKESLDEQTRRRLRALGYAH